MFQSRKTPSRNVPVQVTEFLAKMQNSDISSVTNVVPLETFYKNDSNIDALPAVLKIIGKTHKKYLQVETVFSIFMEDILEIPNCLEGTLLKTFFQNFSKTFKRAAFLNILWKIYETIFFRSVQIQHYCYFDKMALLKVFFLVNLQLFPRIVTRNIFL